jgi:hypothetical protein
MTSRLFMIGTPFDVLPPADRVVRQHLHREHAPIIPSRSSQHRQWVVAWSRRLFAVRSIHSQIQSHGRIGICAEIPTSVCSAAAKVRGATSKTIYWPAQEYGARRSSCLGELGFSQKSIWAVMQSSAFNEKDTKMRIRWSLVLCVAAVTLSTSPGNAGPCTREIDREWVEVGAKIQARIGAGRSYVQGTVGLLHHQPTPSSVAAAEGKIGDMWAPLETAVIALCSGSRSRPRQ